MWHSAHPSVLLRSGPTLLSHRCPLALVGLPRGFPTWELPPTQLAQWHYLLLGAPWDGQGIVVPCLGSSRHSFSVCPSSEERAGAMIALQLSQAHRQPALWFLLTSSTAPGLFHPTHSAGSHCCIHSVLFSGAQALRTKQGTDSAAVPRPSPGFNHPLHDCGADRSSLSF